VKLEKYFLPAVMLLRLKTFHRFFAILKKLKIRGINSLIRFFFDKDKPKQFKNWSEILLLL